jgi:nicotinate-nucleotide--dimethylbenzimidazole phosphoribosyltransferase
MTEKQFPSFNIGPIKKDLLEELKSKVDHKTKPIGALGILEVLALKIGLVQHTSTPSFNRPHIVVFAGDHGIVSEKVSAYPQEVTYQMVYNFLNGGAAINVFCKQNQIDLKIVDAGVNYDFPDNLGVIDLKIGKGTKNFLREPAMLREDAISAIICGASLVKRIQSGGCNVIGFGEMGIGNTTSASAIMSVLCSLPVSECVGKGTGLSNSEKNHKQKIIEAAIEYHNVSQDPLAVLFTFGGFEIAQLVGAILQAAELDMIILIDGFIVSVAFLIAFKIEPNIYEYAIFCHKSDEFAHGTLLNYLQAKPLLNLGMRLGEGTGVAVAFPVIKSAVCFINEMASFESASVSQKEGNNDQG